MDDFFADLMAEVSQIQAKTDKKAKVNTLRAKAHNKNATPEVRREADLEYRAIMAELEAEQWRAVGTIALFTEQQCDGCGSVHRVFLQYMEEQHHINPRKGRQSLRIMHPDMSLPLSTMIQSHKTHICADCCEDHGFAIFGARMLSVAGTGTLTISSNYLQGDINQQGEAA